MVMGPAKEVRMRIAARIRERGYFLLYGNPFPPSKAAGDDPIPDDILDHIRSKARSMRHQGHSIADANYMAISGYVIDQLYPIKKG